MFDTKSIARAIHLTESAIRQWLSRCPNLVLGQIDGHARRYDIHDAMTILVASELLRHHIGRPHECFAVASLIARRQGETVWVYRPHGSEIVVSNDRPDEAVAIALPLPYLRGRLASMSPVTAPRQVHTPPSMGPSDPLPASCGRDGPILG